jgi:hypothetical protein
MIEFVDREKSRVKSDQTRLEQEIAADWPTPQLAHGLASAVMIQQKRAFNRSRCPRAYAAEVGTGSARRICSRN